LETSWQLVARLIVFYIPLVQQVANLLEQFGNLIDLSIYHEMSWQIYQVAN